MASTREMIGVSNQRTQLFSSENEVKNSVGSSLRGYSQVKYGPVSRVFARDNRSRNQEEIFSSATKAPTDKSARKKKNYDKSLQLLAEQEVSRLPVTSNQSISREAEMSGLGHPQDVSIFESSTLEAGDFQYGELDQSTNVSFRSEALGLSYSGRKYAKVLEKSAQRKAEDYGNLSMVIESDPVMQGTKGLFAGFMESVNAFSKSSDVFELVGSFEELLRQEIGTLASFLRKTDPSRKRFMKTEKMLQILYQECYTWRLLASLFRDRLQSEAMDTTGEPLERRDCFKSEKEIVDAFYERDHGVRQCQLIVDWLEKNAEDDLEELNTLSNIQFGLDSVSWEQTISQLQLIDQRNKEEDLLLNLVTEIDPDAPIRQRRKLADLDEQDEERLLRHVFACVRSGQLQKAQELCCKYGQSWRAATLDGWRLWNDANYVQESETGELVQTEGNPYRDVWKAACWAMMEESTIDRFEKAIYAALSGNLKHLLPVCASWQDTVWAYFKVMVDSQVEQELNQHSRTDRPTEELPSAFWENAHRLTPEVIFAEIRSLPDERIRRQAEEPFHVIQRLLILNEIEDLFTEMDNFLGMDHFCKAHIVRFMAHLALFLQNASLQVQDEVCGKIMKCYIEILVASQQKDLVACYTSKLPPEDQVAMYSAFLEQIEKINERQRCIQLAEEAGLDTATITKTVVENIRTKEMHVDVEETVESDVVSQADRKQIEAIQWLVFDPSLRAEALRQANAIMRCFLATSKVSASRQVYEQLPEDTIDVVYKEWQKTAGDCSLPDDYENSINEYLCVRAYLDAHSAFNDWHHHYHSLTPIKPAEEKWRSFTERVEYEQKMNDYELLKERWQRNLDTHVEETKQRLYNVLLFPEGWMVDKVDTSTVSADHAARSQQLLLLRQICIPLVCSMLHAVLRSNGQHKEFLQLADLIQSETHRLYEVFQRDQLQRMLVLFKDSALTLLACDKDAFGYDKFS